MLRLSQSHIGSFGNISLTNVLHPISITWKNKYLHVLYWFSWKFPVRHYFLFSSKQTHSFIFISKAKGFIRQSQQTFSNCRTVFDEINAKIQPIKLGWPISNSKLNNLDVVWKANPIIVGSIVGKVLFQRGTEQDIFNLNRLPLWMSITFYPSPFFWQRRECDKICKFSFIKSLEKLSKFIWRLLNCVKLKSPLGRKGESLWIVFKQLQNWKVIFGKICYILDRTRERLDEANSCALLNCLIFQMVLVSWLKESCVFLPIFLFS